MTYSLLEFTEASVHNLNIIFASYTEAVLAILILGTIFISGLIMEKGDLKDGVKMLIERAKNETLL